MDKKHLTITFIKRRFVNLVKYKIVFIQNDNKERFTETVATDSPDFVQSEFDDLLKSIETSLEPNKYLHVDRRNTTTDGYTAISTNEIIQFHVFTEEQHKNYLEYELGLAKLRMRFEEEKRNITVTLSKQQKGGITLFKK